MPWTTPGTAVAGAVLEASLWNSDVRDNSLMGNPVFTNEAARDAAIASPSEGQTVYLTAPTIPAATGTTMMIPSGIYTVYNGTAWVCITPIAGNTPASGTTTSGSYTASLSGTPGTNPSVTLVTGDTAMVSVRATIGSGTSGQGGGIAIAISGATTKAANLDDTGIFFRAAATNQDSMQSGTTIISGLTAGTNTFTMQYFSTGGATASFSRRVLIVSGVA